MLLPTVARLALLVVVLGWLPAAAGLSQASEPDAAPAAAPVEVQAPQPIPLEDVPDRAEAVRSELGALLPGEASRQELERIASELDPGLAALGERLARAREVLAGQPNARTLKALEAELRAAEDALLPWDRELDGQLDALRSSLVRLDETAAIWKETAALARREGTAATTVRRIQAVRREVGETRAAVVAQREAVLAVRDRLVDPGSSVRATLERLQTVSASRLEGMFRVDRPPLWSAELREALAEEWRARGQIRDQLAEGGRYVREHARRIGGHLALFVFLWLGLRLLRDRAREWAEEEYNLREAKEVFERPVAMALILSAVVAAPLYALAPRVLFLVASPVLALAAVSIGRRFLAPSMAPLFWGLMVVYVIDRLRAFLDAAPTFERLASLAEILGALGLLLWLQRPARLVDIPSELRRSTIFRGLGAAMRVGAVLLGLALVADLMGWGNLSSLLGSGVLEAAVLGVFVFVSLKVFESLLTFALVLWPLRLLHGISRHRLLVRRRLEALLSVVAVGAWAALALAELGLLGVVQSGISGVLAAGISVGALSVSLGGVLAFALTIWLSFLLARTVDFVLQEDVFTRVRTSRGVPYAISGLVRYSVIFLGFMVSLAAAGLELGKLTVVAGGLGVGVGFGLQNVVNNFVSGLILLFERPIQVGDTVQLPEVWGDMKRIGIRSSVIRTFDGAEVIVPNGMLLAEKVTNWTLSDTRRRIEVDVGVAYETPAPRVIELLLDVAKDHARVMTDPAPQAFFMAFGDSALQFKLRAWIGRFEDGFQVRSDLTVAVQDALEKAGITVPFPQRDLHLVSVNPEAAKEPEHE